MARVEVTKSVFGSLRVGYNCPSCKERLRSSLNDAGKPDSCPNCHVQFTVPGIEELNREKERIRSEKERKQAEGKRKSEEIAKQRERKLKEQEELVEAKRIAAEEARLQQKEESERQRVQQLSEASDEKQPYKIKKRTLTCAITAIGVFALVSIVYSVSTNSGAGITDVIRSSGLRSKLKRCESYGIVEVDAYYDGAISTETVVFDFLDGGTTTARRIDPVHLLLQFSDKLDLYSIRRIILARNGKHKFYISSSDMRPLAESYANGGRPWAFNNLPQSVRTMSGFQAYNEWSGGWLGVMQKQAEDLNDFIKEWTGY